MYAEARSILSEAITLTKEERRQKVELAIKVLRITRGNQIANALRLCDTDAQMEKKKAQIESLYQAELSSMEEELKQLTTMENTNCLEGRACPECG